MILFGAASYFNKYDEPATLSMFTLLLAFPAAAAAWVGIDRTHNFFGGSAKARVISLTTFAVSVFAVLASLKVDWPPDFPRFGDADGQILGYPWPWGGLLVVSGATMLVAVYLWLSEAIMYARFSGRAPDGVDKTWDEVM
ncbi:hypothetical protein [Ornithinimicrobium cryptoxanthini]|uniref:Uncharacterized protein n=1 Tax=Ornithinimicrobium cryptoxanthini TaxID=2934161 RepID=A0ABY4YFV7_9MICO|nr:hypothetical protein [Ornithinimicrobium cryptoxanthini]USQ75654.1 hypothetical protein NF557_13690 [Ornithinimicrobium cryptoxanthini]